MDDPLILAYLAGVIDSDGCIGIKRSTYAMRVRGDAGQPVYSERIDVKQVEPQAVRLLHETFGGSLGIQPPNAKRGRPFYAWHIHSAAAGRALARLRPYLRIKAAQADNALALRALMGQGRRWPVPGIVEGEPMVTATEFGKMAGARPTVILQACGQGSVPSVRQGRSRMVPISFLPAYKARLAAGGKAPRAQETSAEMERLYQRAKELNRVGVH